MIYPIVIYGSQTLRNKSVDITPDYPELKKLIDDMFLTLDEASGVGLAAPQIGKNIRLFIVAYQYAVYHSDGSYIGKSDPYGFHTATRPNMSSKIYDLNTGYSWGDQSWMTYRASQNFYTAPMNIYECHLGSWRRTGDGQFLSYRAAADFLVPYTAYGNRNFSCC